MSAVKGSKRSGKKQVSTAGKKAAVAKSGKAGAGASKGKAKRKGSHAAFGSLKSKQMTVERMKRAIWESLFKINNAIITAASGGHLAAAKELFDFAGVYSLPNPDEEEAAVAARPVATPASGATPEAAMVHPIDLFFKKIGVEPSDKEPEPEVA